ncbi:MAG: type II toxin-antitoxin system Phd/YefM family antitoxin [Bryobacteraceae bacterium]
MRLRASLASSRNTVWRAPCRAGDQASTSFNRCARRPQRAERQFAGSSLLQVAGKNGDSLAGLHQQQLDQTLAVFTICGENPAPEFPDHGLGLWYKLNMREIAISKFKATCLAVLEDVRRTGAPVRVTRFGRPVAEVVPASPKPVSSWLGCARHSIEVSGDIAEPVGAFSRWTARK